MATTTEQTKAVVQGIYDAVMKWDMDAFGAALHPDLRVASAPYPASEDARLVTGVTLPVDCGFVVH